MDPFGTTRSRVRPDHALICPDSFVAAALPGWERTKCVVLTCSAMGARFSQYLALMEPGGAGAPALAPVERFLFVLEGEVEVNVGKRHHLGPGGFAYLPPDGSGSLHAITASRVCVFEKRYQPVEDLARPASRAGHERDIAGTPFLGDPDAVLQVLLPDEPAFDLAVNLFTYRPARRCQWWKSTSWSTAC